MSKFLFLLQFLISTMALADLGDPGRMAWTTVTLNSGDVREGLSTVVAASYNTSDSKMSLVLVRNDKSRETVPFNVSDKELKIQLDWTQLEDVGIGRNDRIHLPGKLALDYPFTKRCEPNKAEEIDFKEIKSIHWHFQLSKSARDELLKKYSEENNFKGCGIASCYIGGDGDCRVTFSSGSTPEDKVKDTLELYYQAEAHWSEYKDEETFIKKLLNIPSSSDLSKVKELIERSHASAVEKEATCVQKHDKERTDCFWHLTEKLRKDVKVAMKPFLEKWKVKFISADPFSVKDRLLPEVGETSIAK
jgi:hypothetical protein